MAGRERQPADLGAARPARSPRRPGCGRRPVAWTWAAGTRLSTTATSEAARNVAVRRGPRAGSHEERLPTCGRWNGTAPKSVDFPNGRTRSSGRKRGSMTDDERVYERRWWTLGILCLSLVMIIVGNTVLNVALPTLIREIDASSTDLQWMVDAYALVFAGLLLTGGALGDRFGRKGALTIGLVIFGVASRAGRHVRLGQPGHRHPGDHGRRRGPGDAGHPVDPRHRLPAPGAGPGHRRVGRAGRGGGGHRPHRRRLAARALLVGVGVPRQHPRDRRRPGGRALPRPHLPRPPQAAARPDRRGPVDRRPRLAPLRHHRGPHPRLDRRTHAPRGRHRPGVRPAVRGVGAAHAPPHARPAVLQEPPVQLGLGRHHAGVLRPVRHVLPAHPVPAAGAGLLRPGRRGAHPARPRSRSWSWPP